MNNSIKCKNIICILLIAMLLVFTTNAYAVSDSFKTTLTVNKAQAKRGEEITVTIALSDIAIESGEKGIGAYTASIDFDTSVLEYVSTNGTDKWDKPFYQNMKIAGTTGDGKVVNTAQNIGTITFKVKDNAGLGETTIKLLNFSGSTAESDVKAADTSVKITILSNDTGTGSGSGDQGGAGTGAGTGTGSGSIPNGGTGGSGNGSNLGGTNKGDTVQGKLPKTGDSSMYIFILVGGCALVAITSYIKIKSINK